MEDKSSQESSFVTVSSSNCTGIILILFFFLLATVCYVAHFQSAPDLGLNDDDFSHVSPSLERPFGELPRRVISAFTHLDSGFGRPVEWTFLVTLTAVGSHLGKLTGVYLIGSLILLGNSLLLFALLRRDFSIWIAMTTSIFFILYPAYTTKPYLTHAIFMQPTMSLLILAMILYLHEGKAHWARIASYILVFMILLSYEAFILPFLLVPFLEKQKAGSLRRSMYHWGVCTLLIMIVTLLRISAQEPRLTNALASDYPTLIGNILLSLIIGPYTSLKSSIARTLTPFVEANPITLLLTLAIFIPVFIFSISTWRRQSSIKANASCKMSTDVLGKRKRFIKLLLIGLAMLSISYAFIAFKAENHFPPDAVAGRPTSIHIVGSLGAAFIFASIISLVEIVLKSRLLNKLLFAIIACYLAALIAFGILIQEYYVRTWQEQISTWRQILKLTPDAGKNTVIIVSGKCLFEGTYASAYTHIESSMFKYLFNIPAKVMPRTFFVCSENTNIITLEFTDNRYRLKYTKFAGLPAGSVDIDANNTILLEWNNSELRRKYILRKDDSPPLKLRYRVITEPLDRSETHKLYDYMFVKN